MANVKSDEERLGSTLGVRLTADENARLEALVARVPIVTKHAIARVALRIGLEALEADPARYLIGPAPKPKGAAPTARKVKK
jgi:hypothetical protein